MPLTSVQHHALIANWRKLATTMADQAGEIALRYYRQEHGCRYKDDDSPVTLADREIEHALRRLILAHCPDHGILGEEEEAIRADAEWLWIIDPIDGTRNFICGKPLFTTLIALCHRQVPVLGIIDQPVLKERWFSETGGATSLNHHTCHSSGCTRLAEARLGTTSPYLFNGPHKRMWETLREQVAVETFSADAYGYALLASGHIDLIAESGLKPYDFLPLIPVIENAGGVISDWNGQPLTIGSAGHVLASASPSLHEQALTAMGGI